MLIYMYKYINERKTQGGTAGETLWKLIDRNTRSKSEKSPLDSKM